MKRQFWFRVLTVVAVSGLGLLAILSLMMKQERLVVERKGVRIQAPPLYLEEPGFEVTGQRYVFDEVLGWRNIPNWTAKTFGRELRISSRGLRDGEYDYERQPGVPRVLVLGDSYTWGYGVGNDEIFTEVMEQKLNSGGTKCEVINTGVSGWGTDQEYLFFREEGHKYRPDIVVLAFFLNNDPVNNVASVQYGLGKPVFPTTDLSRFDPPRRRPGVRESFLEPRQPLEITTAIIRGLQEECAKIDARLVFMKFGAFGREDVTPMLQFSKQLTERLAETMPDLRTLDLDEVFRARGLKPEQIMDADRDLHWNARGHRIVAEALQEYLQSDLRRNSKV